MKLEVNMPVVDKKRANITIVRVSIYDIMGREVKGMNKKLSMGINTLDIDTDTPLSGGVYFAVMEYEGKAYKEKFIILK